MKKIKILLDYKCYPMWIYDQNDELVDNDLVEELRSDKEIDEMLMEILRIYDSLFIDDSFEYKGFVKLSERTSYLENIEKVLVLIKRKSGEKYIIVNDIDI